MSRILLEIKVEPQTMMVNRAKTYPVSVSRFMADHSVSQRILEVSYHILPEKSKRGALSFDGGGERRKKGIKIEARGGRTHRVLLSNKVPYLQFSFWLRSLFICFCVRSFCACCFCCFC